ncbi:MAG: D-alanyl-D-alanine carboxypeptidase [Oscillospiraceae bacterium]|nr:D-alanyl-D-alanine carboxypeptidase [Oscillospiraceae bacterium]
MTRLMGTAVFLLCALCLFAHTAYAAEEGFTPNFSVQSKAAYLYNMDTGDVIYAQNAHEKLPPASLTKIMTAVLAMELADDLDFDVVVYPGYVQDFLYDYQYIQGNGIVSNAELMAGDELTIREALYALMLPSGNEVAMSLAHHFGGGQQGFVDMMNRRARELGMSNTNFVNANGLFDPEHVTTAYDLALLTMHAIELPGFMEIVNTTVYQSPAIKLHPDGIPWITTNRMIVPENENYYPPVRGVKTGTLPQAGRCFISTASKDGFTYLLVVMGAPYLDEDGAILPRQMAFVETRQFYEWVFDTFRVKTLVDKGRHVGDIELRLNMEQDRLRLMTAERFTALLPTEIEASSVEFELFVPDFLVAPVQKHDRIGEAALILNGEEKGRVDLLAAESVDASYILVVLESVREVTRSFWFKFAVVGIVMLIVFYIVMMIIRNNANRRSGYRPRRRL